MKRFLLTSAMTISALTALPFVAEARKIPDPSTVHTIDSYTAELNRLLENIHYEQPTQRLLIKGGLAQQYRQVFQNETNLSNEALRQLNATGNSVKSTLMSTIDPSIQHITFSNLTLDTFEERESMQQELDRIARSIYMNERPKTTYAVVAAINRYIAENYI